jgi:hypothetical protein
MALKAIVKRLIGPALTRRIQQARLPHYDGRQAKQWWRTRDRDEAGLTEFYWQSRQAPARRAIAEAVAALDGDSLLEIGCHAGPNLWAIGRTRAFDRLAGTDLSPTVLAEARSHLAAAGLTGALAVAAADALPFADKSFDICLTSVTLVCAGPETIDASLDEIVRVTAKWLVLCEPWSEQPRDRPDYYPNTTYWIRNYRAHLRGRAEMVSVRHLPREDHIGHLDSISIYKLLPERAPPA